VGVALFAIEEAAHAELARQRAVDRFVEQQVARQRRAEAAVGLDLLGQFAVDALEVVGLGVDLAFVLQGDALFRVLLAADGEGQGAAALLSTALPGFASAGCRRWPARCPAP
jgi:hypothetical protein